MVQSLGPIDTQRDREQERESTRSGSRPATEEAVQLPIYYYLILDKYTLEENGNSFNNVI